mmetsp:Transcript_16142/g.27081  ORF Transcript_16142/g.27081 Transcript_16142/m.27081 type:complete len:240 (+) Transcript_16142:43-762(+)
MDPATAAWAAARIAPIQVCIWGHPSTTGYAAMDYYLSSSAFHQHTYQPPPEPPIPAISAPVYASASAPPSSSSSSATTASSSSSSVVSNVTARQELISEPPAAFEYFSEQLVLFDSLGFYFERPILIDNSEKEVPSQVLIQRPDSFYQQLHTKLLHGTSTDTSTDTKTTTGTTTTTTTLTVGAVALADLIRGKLENGTTYALCPQHLPKFHPHFDAVVTAILTQSLHSHLLIIDNKKKK